MQEKEGDEKSGTNDVEKGDSLGGDDGTGQYSYLTVDVCS
jgi:hypothetical protein